MRHNRPYYLLAQLILMLADLYTAIIAYTTVMALWGEWPFALIVAALVFSLSLAIHILRPGEWPHGLSQYLLALLFLWSVICVVQLSCAFTVSDKVCGNLVKIIHHPVDRNLVVAGVFAAAIAVEVTLRHILPHKRGRRGPQ